MPHSQHRQLAAILFADIAGYTSLMQRNESMALQKLSRFKEVLEKRASEFQGNIIQYYGDGCLMIFQSPVEAVQFSIAIQKDFKTEPEVPVRVGIHTGDVVLKDGFVFGDAVNITSRIESMGTAGTVLLSETLRDQIKNKPEFVLTTLGKFSFKNVELPMEIFALSNESMTIPKREDMEGKQKAISAPSKSTSPSKRALILTAVLIILGIGWIVWGNQEKDSGQSETEKSIAVMPLRNLSGDRSQDYFAEGIVEAIYSKLAHVRHLRVTSMTSMLSYRNVSKPLMEIAKELDVNHILEGSVSKDKNKVRIIVRLVDAKNDRLLWTQTYDRMLTELFEIQNNIAQSVVTELETTLSQQEKDWISRLKVTDLTAYDLYLSGLNDFHEYGFILDTAFNEAALRKSKRALKLDPQFDKAYSLLADCWFARREYGFGDIALDSSDYYAGQALQLNADNDEALYRKAMIAWDKANYEESRRLVEKALKIAPNNDRALQLLATYYMEESESVEESIPLLVKAIALDPKNPDQFEGNLNLYVNLGNIYLRADLLTEAEALFLKALEISSGRESLQAVTALGYLYHVSGKFDRSIEFRKKQLSMTSDDFGAINEYAGANYAAGNFSEAEKYYRKLLELIEKGFHETHHSYIFRHRLAHIMLMDGRTEEANKLFKEHLDNEMADLDSGTRHFGQEYAIAGAYAAMGNTEKAFEWLGKMPFWYISYQFIRVDPMFKSLRGMERFEKIMAPHHEKMHRLQQSIKALEANGQLQLMLDLKEL